MVTELRISFLVITMMLAIAVFIGGAVLVEGSSNAGEPWEAPVRSDQKKNPIPADAQSLALGKEVFVQNCLPCHGASGKGDGPASQALETRPGDLTNAQRMGSQTDGALFWKIGEGKGPMPQWKDAITDEDRWRVINYVRTLASKK